MDFSNLPQLQIDQLIKPISRRLLRNQLLSPFMFHGPKQTLQRHTAQGEGHSLLKSYPAHKYIYFQCD